MAQLHLGSQEELHLTIPSNSVDAVITDPPYNLQWNHKIESRFCFKQFIENSYRVLKNNGFFVYFGQEPTMSQWNILAQEKFHYLAEIIWYKRASSSVFHYPMRTHEKVIIFTKGKGKLNKATIDWAWEKRELIEYTTKEVILRTIGQAKKLINSCNDIEELRTILNAPSLTTASKVGGGGNGSNDAVYSRFVGETSNRKKMFVPKKLTTLWGCRPHNHQGYGNENYNVKHPTVKPIQIIERLVEMTTKEGDVVLDAFMGSGTTGIACHRLDRKFIGFEIDKEYFEIAKNRLEDSIFLSQQLDMFG